MSSLATGMSLEERIGQLFVVGFGGTTVSPEIRDLIENGQVGGIILFSRNVHDMRQLGALTRELQAVARAAGHRYPLLIATDQENGLVRRLGADATGFPGNMALGAVDSEEIAFAVAQATGQELRALGINMNLAPDVDVNNNPANPVIGVRSFGEDPQRVARLGAATVRGYEAAGVIATLKHFPGHGDTAADSHLALPVILHTMQRLNSVELVPFREGIAAGAPVVMSAHIALPALMADATLPATVSPEVIRGLLRETLGFEGVVISDCLEMEGVAATVGVARGAVLTLRAGVDLVLVSHRHDRQHIALAAVQTAAANGELDVDALEAAMERVLHLKRRYLSWETLPAADALDRIDWQAHAQLRDHAYALTTTLARDERRVLPVRLNPTQRLVVVAQTSGTVSQAVDILYSHETLVERLRSYHANTVGVTLNATPTPDEYSAVLQAAGAADLVVLVTLNAHLDPRQIELGRRLAHVGRPLIGIAVGNPYDVAALPEIGSYLATYEYSQPAMAAVARVLFGAAPAPGHAPITLHDQTQPH